MVLLDFEKTGDGQTVVGLEQQQRDREVGSDVVDVEDDGDDGDAADLQNVGEDHRGELLGTLRRVLDLRIEGKPDSDLLRGPVHRDDSAELVEVVVSLLLVLLVAVRVVDVADAQRH